MATAIIMPKAGMAMEEGTIIKWLKAEGDQVVQGEPLLEILTDKVNMEVEAMASGTLIKILRQPGEVIPVTQVIGYLGTAGEAVPEVAAPAPQAAVQPSAQPVAPASPATPAAQPAATVAATPATDPDAFDVVVIGGGPAGYVAALKAAQLGGRVALVEKDQLGGTCVNRGCIPTKTYLKNAEIIASIEHAAQRGIKLVSTAFQIDMEQVVSIKNDVVKSSSTGVKGLLRSYKVKLYSGTAKITRDKKVIIDGETVLNTAKIIIASGSKPSRLNIPGLDNPLVLTSDEILDLKEIPAHLAIIGGGVIGLELAQVFRSYGSAVTIIEMESRLVPFMDEEISAELQKIAVKKGIKVLTSTKLEKLAEVAGGLEITTSNGVISANKALLSIGRVADLEAIGEIEITLNRNKIVVNDQMETSVEGIYAPGDVNGRWMLAHAAYKMGEVAAENAMGHPAKADLRYVPSCIYTLPEVGSVGLTEAAARERHDISIGRFVYSANGRAMASGEWEGFAKVIIDSRYGEILGVHLIGPGAAEIVNEAAALMASEITAHEAAEIIHGHPTYSEALVFAIQDSLKQCIHKAKIRN